MSGHADHGAPPAPPATTSPREGAQAPEVSSLRLLGTLTFGGAVAGFLIVTTYAVTRPTIERYEAIRAESAIREVLRAPARWDTLYLQGDSLTKSPTGAGDRKLLPRAYVGFDAAGATLGVAVTAAEPGFQDNIRLMIGFEPASGTIIGFKILEQKETPGLGDKIELDTAFISQFAGRAAPLKGVKARNAADPSQVQTITGATISSRAVVAIINHAVEQWQPLLAAYDRGGSK